jgi:hypothetical protein
LNFIGGDVRKKIITICVMNEKLSLVARKAPYCNQPEDATLDARADLDDRRLFISPGKGGMGVKREG